MYVYILCSLLYVVSYIICSMYSICVTCIVYIYYDDSMIYIVCICVFFFLSFTPLYFTYAYIYFYHIHDNSIYIIILFPIISTSF
jgi:hypothetical protein